MTGGEKNTGSVWGSRNKLKKAEKQENTWCFGKSLVVQSQCQVCLRRSQAKKLGLNSDFNRDTRGFKEHNEVIRFAF